MIGQLIEENGNLYFSDPQGFLVEPEELKIIAERLLETAEKDEGFIKEFNKELEKEQKRLWHFEKIKAKPGKDEQCVYLLECNGKYKIGISKNLQRRLRELDKRPFKLDVLCYSQMTNKALDFEQELMKRFENKRINGEWFDLNEDEVDQVRETILSIGGEDD